MGVRGWGRGLRKGGSVGEESACNAGDTGDAGSIPGMGRTPGGENGNPVQYSCLENAMDRGAWRATVHGVAKSQTQLRRLKTCSPWGGFLSGLIRNVPDGVAVMTAQHGEDTTDSDCLLRNGMVCELCLNFKKLIGCHLRWCCRHPRSTDGVMEVQGGQVTCSRSHSWGTAEPVWEPGSGACIPVLCTRFVSSEVTAEDSK